MINPRFGRLMIAVLLVCGCAEPRSADESFPAWEAELELEIGAEDDVRRAFDRISGVATDKEGRIYVADSGYGLIRVFSEAGEYIRSIGGPGDGPGEFRSLGGIGLLSDTIFAIERGARSAAVLFDSSGAYLRTIAAVEVLDRPASVSGVLQDGRLVLIGAAPMASDQLLPRMVAAIDGSSVDTLDSLPSGEGVLALAAPRGQVYLNDPFALPRFLPVHRSGEWWLRVSQYPEGSHSPGQFTLTKLRTNGDSVWSKTMSEIAVPWPSDAARDTADRVLAGSALPIPEVDLRAALRPPSHHYVLERVIVAHQGDIWLRVRRPEGTSWIVLDPAAGEIVARVELPANAVPWSVVDRNVLLAVVTNDLGVQRVGRFRLAAKRASHN